MSSKIFQFHDDARRSDALNGQPASAAFASDMIDSLNTLTCRYRPIFNFWGGGSGVGGWPTTPLYRQSWANVRNGCDRLANVFTVLPAHGQAIDGQGVNTLIDGVDNSSETAHIGAWSDQRVFYPTEASVVAVRMPFYDTDHKVKEVAIGSNTTNGPQIRSGMLFEPNNDGPSTGATSDVTEIIPTDWVVPGAPIIGDSGTAVRSVRGWRDLFRETYKARRLAFGWSCDFDRSDAPISVPGTSYRYIGDQEIGDGGTAPSTTGPGMTVPLRYAASGIKTKVRLYIRIYAAMTNGGGGFGSFGVFTRSGSGMSASTAITDMPTVTSTTFAWYGCANGVDFREANDAWFEGAADQLYDRVLLAAKTSNAANPLRVGAWSINAYHGTR